MPLFDAFDAIPFCGTAGIWKWMLTWIVWAASLMPVEYAFWFSYFLSESSWCLYIGTGIVESTFLELWQSNQQFSCMALLLQPNGSSHALPMLLEINLTFKRCAFPPSPMRLGSHRSACKAPYVSETLSETLVKIHEVSTGTFGIEITGWNLLTKNLLSRTFPFESSRWNSLVRIF